MTDLWTWLAVAGLGALHGLNPASGWMWAAAWGMRSRDRSLALRELLPIAAGHAASVALVGLAVGFGFQLDGDALLLGVAGLLSLAVTVHLAGHTPRAARAPAG